MAGKAGTKTDPIDQRLEEDFPRGELLSEARVDRDAGIISNVKLLGKISRNGRTYAEQALQDAARLYEGAPYYFNHPTDRELKERKGVRDVFDLAGRVQNVRRVGEEVRGDLQVLNREPGKSLVFALAEQMPQMAGSSHRAQGMIRPGDKGGNDVVESLSAVFAVELVTDPATTAGLFESVQEDDPMDFSKLTLADLKKNRPELVESIVSESKGSDELETVKAENKTLKEAAAKRERTELISTKLAEAKLPEALVTDAFKAQLAEAKDAAAIEALLADRKELAKNLKPANPPKSRERKVAESTDEPKPIAIEEAKLGDHARALGLRLIS